MICFSGSMNRRVVFVLVLISITASGIITIQPIKVGSKTIVVPDDYPTITAAIGNATDGDTIFVRSGIYEEKTLEINKTVSLVGENANNTKIRLHPPYFPTLLLGRRL